MMEWLVVIHVLAAVLGLGPAFAFPVLLRKSETVQEMGKHLELVARLELFPKVFGTLAVLSGVALLLLGSYGGFAQLWIIGTLAVYVVIEVLVVGMLNPAAARLSKMIAEEKAPAGQQPGAGHVGLYTRIRSLHSWACVLSLVIFVLMILKP